MSKEDLQNAIRKYNEVAIRIAKERITNEPIRPWSFPFKYVPDDPNNFVSIPDPLSIWQHRINELNEEMGFLTCFDINTFFHGMSFCWIA